MKTHLPKPLVALRDRMERKKRKIKRGEQSIIKEYLSQNGSKKLHIGCCDHLIGGWLNSDIIPTSEHVLRMDACKRFPFDDEVFSYVFSEHTIEHMTYRDGLAMLKESHRVLHIDGKIRISTPDLRFLIDLYQDNKTDLQTEYIQWATKHFIPDAPHADDTFVINNFVRDWGHLFIYDEKTLRSSLESVGFTDIVRCELNDSEHDELRNLENDARMPVGMMALESFSLEATKSPHN